jgi:hypothetical protein
VPPRAPVIRARVAVESKQNSINNNIINNNNKNDNNTENDDDDDGVGCASFK